MPFSENFAEPKILKAPRLPKLKPESMPLQQKYICGLYCKDCVAKKYGKQLLEKSKIFRPSTAPLLDFVPWSIFGLEARLQEVGLTSSYYYFNKTGSLEDLIAKLGANNQVVLMVFRDYPDWHGLTGDSGPHWIVLEKVIEFGQTTFFEVYDPDQGKVLVTLENLQKLISPQSSTKTPMDWARRFLG